MSETYHGSFGFGELVIDIHAEGSQGEDGWYFDRCEVTARWDGDKIPMCLRIALINGIIEDEGVNAWAEAKAIDYWERDADARADDWAETVADVRQSERTNRLKGE